MPPLDDLAKLVVLVSVFAVPAIGITARFALKPIVDSIIRLRQTFAETSHIHIDNDEVRMLRHDVAELKETVRQLRKVVEVDRHLGPSEKRAIPPGQS